MTALLPQSVATPIQDQMSRVIVDLGHYLSEDDERVVMWSDELAKTLQTRDALLGLKALAFLRHMVGDAAGAEKFLDRGEVRGLNQFEADDQRLLIYTNLGYASRALETAKRINDAQQLDLREGLTQAVIAGGFQIARDSLEVGRRNGVDLRQMVRAYSQVAQVVEGTSSLGVSDERFAAVLDIAGVALRKRQLFWLDLTPRISFDKEMQCACFRYRLDVSPDEAAGIAMEFANDLVDADLDGVPIVINFVGTKSGKVLAKEVQAAEA